MTSLVTVFSGSLALLDTRINGVRQIGLCSGYYAHATIHDQAQELRPAIMCRHLQFFKFFDRKRLAFTHEPSSDCFCYLPQVYNVRSPGGQHS